MNEFKVFYKDNKELLENIISKYNDELLKEENEIIKDNLKQFVKLNSGGKRIRGILIMLGYYLNNNDITYSMPLASAYEFFQTSILIHDDIIDNDNVRRGEKTIPFYNKEKYKIDDMNTYNSIGLCIGDLGLYFGNKIISDNYEGKDLNNVLSLYNKTVIDTIRGEILDVMIPFKEKNNLKIKDLEKEIMNVYSLKTSYYTIVGPLSLGMKLGNFTDEEIKQLEKFSHNLGVAFQINDDLIGIYKDDTGKVIGSDIEEFKQTILYSYTKNTKYYDELMKYYGKILSADSLKRVREIFEESGAKDYAINLKNKLYSESREILNNIDFIEKDKKDILYGLVDYLEEVGM